MHVVFSKRLYVIIFEILNQLKFKELPVMFVGVITQEGNIAIF